MACVLVGEPGKGTRELIFWWGNQGRAPGGLCSGGGTGEEHPVACILVGEPGKGSAVEMGVGCVSGSCPRGVVGWTRELTLEETRHLTGVGEARVGTPQLTLPERRLGGAAGPPLQRPSHGSPGGGSAWAPWQGPPGARGQKVHAFHPETPTLPGRCRLCWRQACAGHGASLEGPSGQGQASAPSCPGSSWGRGPGQHHCSRTRLSAASRHNSTF